ncbi:tyrosine protein phosphatase [Paenibacillus sp. BSR1-1]|uniref:tyrosine-protein phosphatase n=1 Tax=Paenibacillus sp. BSR1-1 TaxID=3020845 RepID=UPI0025B00F41|nr:CpsB/CapC family capsule biosynthesis tyrosine phosphatase [Paenibacillus sp. BSR1-1]MDN3019269.1 tyrosine protein phosphatase [Paenibacillus sp. BSR1-1]
MIDIHSHIIPCVDDGPQDHIQGLDMARAAVKNGISHLFATPHHHNGQFENPKKQILAHIRRFNQSLHEENIPLTVHLGQELRIHRELFHSLKMDEVLTLDDQGRYLLLELPSGEVPFYTSEIVYELLLREIIPIIVHPERNQGFIENTNQLFELVQEGALTQLTAGSIIGQFGKKVKAFSEKIIEHNLAHFIGSDAHNTRTRRFCLQEAYEAVTKKYDIQRTFYFRENAELLMRGQTIIKEQPAPIRKKLLGIF